MLLLKFHLNSNLKLAGLQNYKQGLASKSVCQHLHSGVKVFFILIITFVFVALLRMFLVKI
jgi:hypothetical protein